MGRKGGPEASIRKQNPKSAVQPSPLRGLGSAFHLAYEYPAHKRDKHTVLDFKQIEAGTLCTKT